MSNLVINMPPAKTLSEAPSIDPSAFVDKSKLGRWTEVGARTKVVESTMGDYSYIVNDGDVIYSDIGKFVNIAAHVRINPGQHPMDRASMHHFQYRSEAYDLGDDDQSFFEGRRDLKVTIGHDVWIGHGVVIQGGVTIGTGSVIGSNAVVTKDVPPYSIAVGVPALSIRERFDKFTQAVLMRIAWWDWSHVELEARLKDFRELSAADFCLKYDPSR